MSKRRRALENLDRDIRDHIDRETQENVERGMPTEIARQAALRSFGNLTRVREDTRAVWSVLWIEHLLQDSRYALRALRRNPGFTLVVILTLALGIGMNAAIFSVFNAVLLRPLTYPDSERLVLLSPEGDLVPVPDYLDWREQATSFERMAAYHCCEDFDLAVSANPISARLAEVSNDFWPLVGAPTLYGRLPMVGERNVLLLSYGLFERGFQRDPSIVGKVILLNRQQVTIVGVLSQNYLSQLPQDSIVGVDASKYIEGYIPLEFPPAARVRAEFFGATRVLAQLKRGVSIQQARAELDAIRSRIAKANPSWFPNRFKLSVVPLQERIVGQARWALWVLLAAVLFVLLIACVNIANLLLARASARQREVAVRVSLGAGRGRILRQFLAEGLIIAFLGGISGLLFARFGIIGIVGVVPAAVPRLAEARIDGSVLGFVLGISVLAALVLGAAPAVSILKADVPGALKDSARTLSSGTGSVRFRQLLVAAEMAFAVVLLSGAGLMLKSYWQMTSYPKGFEPEHILTMKVEFPNYGGPDRARPGHLAYIEHFLSQMSSVPHVREATISLSSSFPILPEGQAASAAPSVEPVVFNSVSGAYAGLMGLRVMKGRWIRDFEPQVSVTVNEAFVRRSIVQGDPLGKQIRISLPPPLGSNAAPTWSATIVGIMSDLKVSKLDAEVQPEVYIPYTHAPVFGGSARALIRTDNDPLSEVAGLRTLVAAVDQRRPVDNVRTLEAAMVESIAPRRFNLFLLVAFAAVALSLAAIGIYGVVSYAVTLRTHELGVRLALGASRGEVVAMVVRQGTTIILAGIVAGLGAAAGLTRLMESLLYDVKPNDPSTFTAVAVVLIISALAACLRPALKAAQVDPILALRHE